MRGEKKIVTIYLTPETVSKLDKLAKMAEMSRTRLMENIMDATVDELETCRKVGLYQMAVLLRDWREKLKERSGCLSQVQEA